MSARGRGAHRGGDVDYYPTPAWCVDRLLDDCGSEILPGATRWLEPTCGDGAIVRAVDAWCVARGRDLPEWTGVELRTGALDSRTRLAHHVEGIDFRRFAPAPDLVPYDVCIGNPPFAIAEAIVTRALSLADVVIMLLRVGFMGASERLPLFRANPDFGLRVLPNRPSFDGEGTDSATYAWFVWGHPQIRDVRVLDDTPIAVRNAQKPGRLAVDPRQHSLFGETCRWR